jgi:hypothetical protein
VSKLGTQQQVVVGKRSAGRKYLRRVSILRTSHHVFFSSFLDGDECSMQFLETRDAPGTHSKTGRQLGRWAAGGRAGGRRAWLAGWPRVCSGDSSAVGLARLSQGRLHRQIEHGAARAVVARRGRSRVVVRRRAADLAGTV